jgi:aryl-alcohol dehydrogenase-like predicted oxidoreductase
VSEIGLGLAALGRPAYINLGHAEDVGPDRSVEGLRAQTHAVLDHAYARGIRYFDAARSYGLAEEFLGSWLADRAPDGVFVASKWGYTYTAGWRIDVEDHEIKDLSAGQLRRQLAETREHLGSWLQLYQIHSATLESGVLSDDEVLSELADLRATGVAIGLSVTGAQQAETIDAALATGAFDAVQATWNLHERAAEPALARAHAAGLKVYVKEALANGRLAAIDDVALAAALHRPWATVVLSGAASTETLRSNLRALRTPPPGERADLIEASADYWAARSSLAWN